MLTALCATSCPQELNLSFGEITEDAALMVARALEQKTQLEKLDLNGTKLMRQNEKAKH